MKGIIKKIEEKGFGFISLAGQKDIFFHANDCTDGNFKEMKEGDAVSFETAESEKGPRAVNVVLDMGGHEAPAEDAAEEAAPTDDSSMAA